MRKGIGGLSVTNEDGRSCLVKALNGIWVVYVIAEHSVHMEWRCIYGNLHEQHL
jgi:hypothetical protein